MQSVFTAYSDPGHGWIKVPRALLSTLNIADKVSRWSYQRDKYVYLEEDGDLQTFVTAYELKYSKRPVFKERFTNKQSKIRNYESYKGTAP